MTNKILCGVMLVFFTGVMGIAAPKTETELRLPLTKKQYEAILAKFKKHEGLKESSRTDTYFEFFRNQSFLLQEAKERWKWRMMEKGAKVEWQLSKITDEQKLTDEKFPGLRITVREKRDGKLDKEGVKLIQESADRFFKEIKDSETAAKCTLHSDDTLRKFFFEWYAGKESTKDLKDWIDKKEGDMIPLAVSNKTQYRIVITTESKVKIETTLGLASRLSATGKVVQVPEIEGEFLTYVDKKQWAAIGTEWIKVLVDNYDLKADPEIETYPDLGAYVRAMLKESSGN